MTRALTPVASSPTDPRFTTVVSSSGFSAGDYVYQRPDGTYGPVASGAVATASFNIDNTFSNNGVDISLVAGPLQTLDGGAYQSMAAKLSNGNVVVTYLQRATIGGLTATRVIFAILDTAGTVVVGPTETGTILTSGYRGASVLALTGGGFVIYYLDNVTVKPTFGIYTNTGTVTTAMATDAAATAGASTSPLYGCALPNGGFALSYSSTSTCYVRAFNATGTGAYAWVALSVNNIAACPIAARSDSNVCVFYMTSLTAHSYRVLDTSGGTVTTGSITVSGVSADNALSVCALADDTFVLAYPATNNTITPRYRTLNTSNVLSSEVTVPVAGLLGSAQLKCLYVVPLSNGGFIYCFTNVDGLVHYVPYNSLGVNQSVGTYVYNFGEINAVDYDLVPGFVERSGYLDVYFYGPSGRNLNAAAYYIFKLTLDLTNYRIYGSSSTNFILGTSSLSVSNYARATSTPTSAAFLASSSSTATLNNNRAANVLSAFTIDPVYTASSNPAITTSPTGEVYIAYKASSPSAVLRFLKYSNAGVFIKAVNLSTPDLTGTGTVDITMLDDGKIVVAEGRTSSSVVLYYCDSNLNVITSGAVGVGFQSSIVAIASIPNNRLVVVGSTGSDIFYRVFDSAFSLVVGTTALGITTTSTNGISVCRTPSGFAIRAYRTTAVVDTLQVFSATGASTYTNVVSQDFGSNQNFASLGAVTCSSSGLILAMGSTSTNSQIRIQTAGTPVSGTSYSRSVDTVSTSQRATLGVTGSGIPVLAACNGTNSGIYLWCVGFSTGSSTNENTNITNYTTNANPRVAPLPGNNIALVYINTSTQIAMGFYSAYPSSYAKAITANVSSSRPSFALNPSSGYTLIGVAATDCAAGGAGQVQVNGVAALNSQYSASTAYQGFDFQVPGNLGVRGTIAGNAVTLIGDA